MAADGTGARPDLAPADSDAMELASKLLSAVRVFQLRFLQLSPFEGQLPGTDLGVELVLGRVHLGGAGIRLRPEVARIGGMTAELEADQVVLLVIVQGAADAVFTHLFPFQVVRVRGRRPSRLRPSVR